MTVTVQVAVLVLSSVAVTVIVAVPAATAVTTPFSTVATASSLDDQDTVFIYALDGVIVAVNVAVHSGSNVRESSFKDTQVTATFSTLMTADAFTAQLVAVTAISSQTATGVTSQVLLTVTLFEVVLQVTGNSLVVGTTVAVNCKVTSGSANLTVQVVGLTEIASG